MSNKPRTHQIKLIFNPGAGNSADAAEKQRLATRYLEQTGQTVQVALARSKAKVTRLARRAARAGYPLVVAMGGNGTVAAVMQGLLDSQTRLGIIPTGIKNHLAHHLGIPEDLEAACALIVSGQTRTLDLGQVTTARGRKFLFFEMVTIGHLTTLRQAARPKFFLTLDQETKIEVDTFQARVSSAPWLGKNAPDNPADTPPEGWLDISVYPGLGQAELLRSAATLLEGGALEESQVQHYQARKIKVKTSPKLEVSADGVTLGQGTVTLKMLPAVLRIMTAQPGPAAPREGVAALAWVPVLPTPAKNHRQKNIPVPG